MTDISIALAPSSGIPLTRQIASGLEDKAQSGAVRSGQRLPSVRDFAARHGVSVHTVVEAYGQLVARGIIVSRRGSGYFVADRPPPPRSATLTRLKHSLDPSQFGREILADSLAAVRLGGGPVSADWVDHFELDGALRKLSRHMLPRFGSYGTTLGHAPLRELLSDRFASGGMQVPATNILLTNGATQALDLVIRLLVQPSDPVLVDDPGYFQTFWALKTQGARLVGVPRRADGPDMAAFERLCQTSNAKLFFTQSLLQNPTGSSISLPAAHDLLRIAEKHGVLIVEDDACGDLAPAHAPRLLMLDRLRQVIHVGSFSKTLSPGLRVGFVAAGDPEHLEGLAKLKLVNSYASCESNEAIVYSLLTGGHYARHVRRLARRLKERADDAIPRLEREGFVLPEAYAGGTFVWVRHAAHTDSLALARRASAAGILLAPGCAFRPQGEESPYLRFSLPLCTERSLDALADWLRKEEAPDSEHRAP